MSVVVPVFTDVSAYIENVALAGKAFRLRFKYNGRSDTWSMDVLTLDEQPIISGRRVVAEFPLFDRFTDQRLFDGDIVAIDVSGADTEPGRNTIGSRVELVFTPRSELA